jgi:hypothetical protein
MTHFNGETFDGELDADRLLGQLDRVRAACLDGAWRTLDEIGALAEAPPASVSARLRDLRKPRFGSFLVERRRRGDPGSGLFEYRVALPAVAVKTIVCAGIDDFHPQAMASYGKCSMCGEVAPEPAPPPPTPRAVPHQVAAGMRVTTPPMFATPTKDGVCTSRFHKHALEAYGKCSACSQIATAGAVAWKDKTEYARGEREIPRHWEAQIGGKEGLRVAVHRHAFADPGAWFLTCSELGMQRQPLAATEQRQAQAEAVMLIRQKLTGYLRALG